jgi:hypothetical protein
VGYDASAHPVDVELIQGRILPYVRGEGNLDDLVETAVRLAQVRFRANAWGLGLLEVSHEETAARAEKALKKAKKGAAKKKPAAETKRLVPESFDSQLHVWGRPFFITTPSDRVSEVIDRYLAATPKQVDKIAEDMLRELNPDLVGKVKPSAEGTLPKPKQLAAGTVGALNFFRENYPKLAKNGEVALPDGDTCSASELFLHSLPYHAMKFAANLQPGWMGRGHVWFTAFIGRAKLDAGKYVETVAPLFAPLLKDVKGFRKAFDPTITQNYTVGGYVQPKNVPAFREWMEKNTEKMIAACVDEDWDEADADARLDFQKVMEALRDAERRKMGFLEAAEVYSGFAGIMN